MVVLHRAAANRSSKRKYRSCTGHEIRRLVEAILRKDPDTRMNHQLVIAKQHTRDCSRPHSIPVPLPIYLGLRRGLTILLISDVGTN